MPVNTTNEDEHELDPTINVQNLLKAAIVRQDDLRAAETRRVDQLQVAEQMRASECILAERRRIDEQLELRAHYDSMLRDAEANRINAIRVVDVNGATVDRERAATQAAMLANQVVTYADTLRAAAASTATTLAAQLAQQQQQNNDRFSTLERAQYEGKGKESVSDPALRLMAEQLQAVINTLALNKGQGKGMNDLWGWIVGGVMLLIGIISFISPYLRTP